MITTKLKNIVDSVPTLKEVGDAEISIKSAFKIKRVIQSLEEELKTYEEMRMKLFEKYGEKDEKGTYKVPQEKAEGFVKELDELLDTKIEVDSDKLSINSLDGIKLSANKLISIDWMIEE